jgi:hypothetical protein
MKTKKFGRRPEDVLGMPHKSRREMDFIALL